MLIDLELEDKIDYELLVNVERRYNVAGDKQHFPILRYVNTFLNPKARTGRGASSRGAMRLKPSYGGMKPPQAPPPLRPEHRGYLTLVGLTERIPNFRLNAYFRLIEEKHPKLKWNFREAIYTRQSSKTGRPLLEYVAVKCLAHTYRGKLVELKGKRANLSGLLRSVTKKTQIIGLLGHSFAARVYGHPSPGQIFEGPQGQIQIGKQNIIEDNEIARVTKLPKSVLNTYPETQKKLQRLGKKISPFAVIILYHCFNGKRRAFLQSISNLVERPIFAYTGYLGWTLADIPGPRRTNTITWINNHWRKYHTKRLIKQEFNYQQEFSPRGRSGPPGQWVVAIPQKFDVPIMDKLGKDFRKKLEKIEKLEAEMTTNVS